MKLLSDTTNKRLEPAALLELNDEHLEAYTESPVYDAIVCGHVGWVNLGISTFKTFFGKSVGQIPKLLTASTETGELMSQTSVLYDARYMTRVKCSGKNFRVFMPIHQVSVNVNDYFEGANGWYKQDALDIARKLETSMPGVTVVENSVDVSIEPKSVRTSISNSDMGFVEDGELKNVLSVVKSYRLVSAPCTKAIESLVAPSIVDAYASGTATTYDARQYLSGLLRARRFTLFAEIEFSEAAATYICQGTPKLSLIGAFIQNAMVSEQLYGSGRWLNNVSPISAIAEQNAKEHKKSVPRTDANGLTVDQVGNVMWMPNVDNAAFVEAEIEQGGMQPDGCWTAFDAIDPETTEYITAPNAAGRMSRQRKPKGRNQLIYTDWHNARLSFTNDEGALEVMDTSMYRKATVGQLAKILAANLTSSKDGSTLSTLHFAVGLGSDIGAHVQNAPALYEGYFTEADANRLTGLLNTGKLVDWIQDITVVLGRVRGTGYGTRQFTPEEILALDGLVENHWLTLDSIHVNSPLPFVRQLADFLTQTYELAVNNQDRIFGRHVVTTVLKEMALLTVVVKYAGERQQLVALDEKIRANYIKPPLDPIDQIEVKDIPYVSGLVELFPHQVRVWNYLKNNPANAILDIRAGGGKTMLCLLDVAYHLGQGTKLPLIICPENLIKNYINDALWLFKGKMNMVVINGQTFNSPEWGPAKLRQLVDHAPVNTIFLTDFNFVTPRANTRRVQTVTYGTELFDVSLNTEFLKSVDWGYVAIDESHMAKNSSGSLNKELLKITATIPIKRQLTGTYISDNLTDVVGQFALINPQTFGDLATFEDNYFVGGSRRSVPVPGAQRLMYQRMSEDANVVSVNRKEWAALLPKRGDNFWAVEMTDNQRSVYLSILQEQRTAMEARMAEDPTFAAQFQAANDRDGDDNTLDVNLAFYIQRLEQFITAPGSDPYVIAKNALVGVDLISPKTAKVAELIRQHLSSKMTGKIMVWTQYVESAASMLRSMPADIAKHSILYTAATGEESMAAFKSNPNIKILFGCEKSMNTGHNIQHASRIIRLETPWGWGTLEQGESRINRPTLNDPRRHENGGNGINLDWVFCNKSIDVTKYSRMISKLISTVKFYEQSNPAYEELPELTPIRLSKDNIFALNDWQQENGGCLEYFKLYSKYAELEQAEFEAFVADPKNRIEPYTLEEGEILPGSAILKRVPYIAEMGLYAQSALGLVPFTEYIASTHAKKGKHLLLIDDPDWSPEGMRVHTEYGDCLVRGYNLGRLDTKTKRRAKPKSIRIDTPSGDVVSIPLTTAWVITKETASGTDIREAVARKIGVDVGKSVVPKVPALVVENVDYVDDGDRKPTANDAPGFEVYAETYNHYVSLVVNTEDVDAASALPDLKRLGFVQLPDYSYAKILTARTLEAWVNKIQSKLEIHPQYLRRLEEDIENWKHGKTIEKFARGLVAAQRKNWLLEQKVVTPKGVIKPYLVTHAGNVCLCLNNRANGPTLVKAKAAQVPGIKWKMAEGEYWLLSPTKQAAIAAFKELAAKYTITNKADVMTDFAAIRVLGK